MMVVLMCRLLSVRVQETACEKVIGSIGACAISCNQLNKLFVFVATWGPNENKEQGG